MRLAAHALAAFFLTVATTAHSDELTDRGFNKHLPQSKKVLEYTKEHDAGAKGKQNAVDPKSPYGKIANDCAKREFLLDDPAATQRLNRCIEERTKQYERTHPRVPKTTVEEPPLPEEGADTPPHEELDPSGGEAVMDGAPAAPR